MNTQVEFQRVLELYRTNLTQYKATGNVAFNTAATNAKAWLDKYILDLRMNVWRGNNDIREFVETNAKSDQELAKLKTEMASIRKEGPELQTMYETERESQVPEPIDYTLYYTKGAVLLGIGALMAVVAMF